ncbi:hypothetical protein EDB83DRAFT_2532769 [Lactarius deliciosus]|nr:hypothetical protein EDB83DRAFT_2532769 [Lactarius deliciosus]
MFNFQGPSEPLTLGRPSSILSADLLTILSVSNAPAPPSAHLVPAFNSPDEETPITEPVQSKAASRPLPPEPTQALSPRGPPPEISPPVRRDVHAPEPPLGPQVSPTLSSGWSWKGHEGGRNRGPGSRAKTQSGPISKPQTIVVDVAQPLGDTHAPRGAVKSMAIALWIAYAMTKGRGRVISRSSGDRTLLRLPVVFDPTTSVTDMAVLRL